MRLHRLLTSVSVPSALLLLLTACASGGGRAATPDSHTGYYGLAEVEQRPAFIGCAAYEPPHSAARSVVRVLVRYDVTATGQVVNPIVLREPRLPDARGIGNHAIRVASSCRYSPALVAGRPVAVRNVQRYFTFER